MSVFHGPQGRDAMKRHRERKRAEAEARNAASNATRKECGHVHGEHLICAGWEL